MLLALELRASGKSAREIAAVTGLQDRYIPQLTAKYLSGEIEAISGNHYGRNRRNIPAEKEEEILKPFLEKAKKGQIIEASAIKTSYEEAVGHAIGSEQIYRICSLNAVTIRSITEHNWISQCFIEEWYHNLISPKTRASANPFGPTDALVFSDTILQRAHEIDNVATVLEQISSGDELEISNRKLQVVGNIE